MATRHKRFDRTPKMEWVRMGRMKVHARCQRDFSQRKVNKILANFDPDAIGVPVLSKHEGDYHIVDGQHRLRCMREWLDAPDWEDLEVFCEVYDNLTEEEEAALFLRLQDGSNPTSYQKFRIAVVAGWEREVAIQHLVEGLGLKVTHDAVEGAIKCPGTLTNIYDRADLKTLERALIIARDAFGTPGMEAKVIDGLAHFCARYNGEISESVVAKKLNVMHGGVKGLLGKAEQLRGRYGAQKAHCVAAATVDVINKGAGKKITSWWKTDG